MIGLFMEKNITIGCYELPGDLEDFLDFEAYGQYIDSDCAEEYSNGIIEIR